MVLSLMTLSAEQLILFEKLCKHPVLMDRVTRLLEIVENPDGRSTIADDAEELVICELRELGKEMLQEWAKDESKKREESALKSGVTIQRKTKKNFTGIRLTEPSQ